MRKKINPNANLYVVEKPFPVNSSITSINNSYLHEGYQSYMETAISLCYHCKSSGNSALMSICNCDEKLFHEKCLKQWLKQKVDNQRKRIKTENDISLIKCDECQYDIKFKLFQKIRGRSCKQIEQYCSKHKGITTGIILTIMLLIGCLTYVALLFFNVIPMCQCNLGKEVLMIALGVVGGVLSLIMACCCFDCLRTSDSRIDTMYNREGKSHRSSRSQRSQYMGSPRSQNKVVVESVQ